MDTSGIGWGGGGGVKPTNRMCQDRENLSCQRKSILPSLCMVHFCIVLNILGW